uniref:Uncharacterized protein n=1 Tax=Meloidogyne incognita TaxID=6306 RepID=A0A914MDZ9_MELIC
MRSKNIDKQLKLAKINFAIKQTDFFKKMVSKKGEENNDQFLEKMLKVQEKCAEYVFADNRQQIKLAKINLAIEQTKAASKIITKKGGVIKEKHINIFFKNYDACMGTLISGRIRKLERIFVWF